jgi:hypothetical protein
MNRPTRFGLVAALWLLLPVLAHAEDLIIYEVNGKTFYTDDRAKVPADATNIREFVSKQQAAPAKVATDEPRDIFEILSLDTEITGRKTAFWRFSYVLKVKNVTDRPLSGHVDIQWLDADGLVIDDTREWGIRVPARSVETIQGHQLIASEPADQVHGVSASVNLR